MSNLLNNTWTKKVLSLFSIAYGAMVYVFAFLSLFYNVEIDDKVSFFVLLTGVSLFFAAIMAFTRNEIVTKVVIILMMPAILPIMVFYFGEWSIIIPICVFVIAMFFVSGATERTKTIFGTIFLLVYIFGALAYFLLTTLFYTDYKEVVVRKDIVSQTGYYRCYVTDAASNSTLGTKVYVEPNNYDIKNKFIKFTEKGYNMKAYTDNSLNRKDGKELNIEWTIEKRDDIVANILSINPELELNLSEKQLKAIGRSSADKVYLKELTAEDFEALGIKAEGDVMYVEGTARFRYVTAILEERFDSSKREITF